MCESAYGEHRITSHADSRLTARTSAGPLSFKLDFHMLLKYLYSALTVNVLHITCLIYSSDLPFENNTRVSPRLWSGFRLSDYKWK